MARWIGRFRGRIPIGAWAEQRIGLVAGFREKGSPRLKDVSGSMPLPAALLAELDSDRSYWLAIEFRAGDQYALRYRQAVEPSAEVSDLSNRFEVCTARWSIHQSIRAFFTEKRFLEVDTPMMVACPGMEPYLDSFPVGDLYLRTSPELHMKRLLAAGYDKTFQMGACFRAGDHGSLHREEFTMLEWYRAFADLEDLVEDLGLLLAKLAVFSPGPDFFNRGFERVDCVSLFEKYLGLTLRDHEDRDPLRRCLATHRIGYDESDDWDTLYFLLFLNFIEPNLGHDRPIIVSGYPASQAALAKKAPLQKGRLPVCYRFELYIRGIEIANAFYELTDPNKQRERFERDRRRRKELGKTVYALDEAFLAALQSGLPPTAGIALGVDRLVLSVLGLTRLEQVLPFH